MSNNRFRIIAAAALALIATTGVAQSEHGLRKDQIYVLPGVNYNLGQGALNYEGFFSPRIGIGGQFTDNFALELIWTEGETDNDFGPNQDIDVGTYRLDGIYTLDQSFFGGWHPYYAGGFGRTYIDPEIGSRNSDTAVNIGIGLLRPITERLAFRTDLRTSYLLDAEEPSSAVEASLRYAFAGPVGPQDADGDGVSDPTDQCPNTPAGTRVDMNGCPLDSDKDGVPDMSDDCPRTPAGVRVNSRGCPVDSDGDGVTDDKDACPNTPRGDRVDARGCTIVEKPMVERIELQLQFDYDSSDLRPGHFAEIERVAEYMREFPETNAQLEGHTDSRGTEAYNQALSERRAYAVRDYLIDEADIDPRRITAVGYGEARPVATNDTESGRQRNRRVEAVIDTGEMSVRPNRAN